MPPLPPVAIATALLLAFLGFFFGLYALFTSEQRRTTREIRRGVSGCGWEYRRLWWQGNPTSFRVGGRSPSGTGWSLTSEGTAGYDRGWSVQLIQRIPALGGEPDFAVMPRGDPLPRVPAAARELPSGLPAFDALYQVLVLPGRGAAPIDPALAQRLLHWPAGAIAPHSLLAWREPSGLRFEARLPGPPDWPTILNFLALTESLTARLPAPVPHH